MLKSPFVSPLHPFPSKDSLLTEFGRSTLKDRYLLPDEDYQGMFARVASYFSDDNDHAQRILHEIHSSIIGFEIPSTTQEIVSRLVSATDD